MVARNTIFLDAHKTLKIVGRAIPAQVARDDNVAIGQIVSTGNDATFGPYSVNTTFTIVGDAGWTIIDAPAFEADGINADYTISATDLSKLIKVSHATGVTITLPSTLPEGFGCAFMQLGPGAITFIAASGATIASLVGATATAGQYALAAVNVYGNVDGISAAWVLSGDVQ